MTSTEPHTGGMVALVPDALTAQRLRVDRPEALPLDELHLTLAYLGPDVTGWPSEVRWALAEHVEVVLSALRTQDGPVVARAFAHMTMNADGGPSGDMESCAAYGISDSAELPWIQGGVVRAVTGALRDRNIEFPAQHAPFIPHVTAGYGLSAADLTYLGPVQFREVRVYTGEQWIGSWL